MSLLRGVRIVDMTHVWVGPMATRIMADLGADVIKVESAARPDSVRVGFVAGNDTSGDYWNRSPYFAKRNAGKRSIALDVSSEDGRDALVRLLREADALVENYTPGVMRRLRLDYETLAPLNPGLVMVSISGYGQTGRNAHRASYGMSMEPASGVSAVTGYPGEGPMKTGQTWVDHYAGLQSAGALLGALLHRRHTGEGQHVDVSMQEATIPMLAWHVSDWQKNGRLHPPNGSRRPGMVRGTYPCQGPDDWLAISIRDQRQWDAFCRVTELEELRSDPRFETSRARYEHHYELDHVISGWTRRHTKEEAAALLQHQGVPAGPVLSAPELISNPHLRERGFYDLVEIPGFGKVPLERYLGAHFDGEGVAARGRAPMLGEHTEEVLREIAGLTADELRHLDESGTTPTTPPTWDDPAVRQSRHIPYERYRELGSILRIDEDFRERWRSGGTT